MSKVLAMKATSLEERRLRLSNNNYAHMLTRRAPAKNRNVPPAIIILKPTARKIMLLLDLSENTHKALVIIGPLQELKHVI